MFSNIMWDESNLAIRVSIQPSMEDCIEFTGECIVTAMGSRSIHPDVSVA